MSAGGASPVRLTVASDGSHAELSLHSSDDTSAMTVEFLVGLATESGLEVTAGVREALDAFAARIAPGLELRETVAEAVPPEHGVDGTVEWRVEAGSAGDAEGEEEGEDGEERTDFYACSAYTLVSEGQELGRVHAPTEGVDGRDVRGRTLAAKQGKPAPLKLDESILQRDDGVLVAQRDGVLSRSHDRAAIRELLEVAGNVDFSTGNIDFPGDVVIHKAVRDLFSVRSGGTLEVRGLVEAAELRAEKAISLRGGMAGRERGRIDASTDLHAKYLDASLIECFGVLRVEREVINCETVVHGSVESPHGSVIGGELACVGPVQVSTLGSGSNVETRIVVGAVPLLEPKLASVDALIGEVEGEVERIDTELAQYGRPGQRLLASQIERQTELSFERHTLADQLTRCRLARETLIGAIQDRRVIDVRVEKLVHPGVVFVSGVQEFHVRTAIKGPITVYRDGGGALVFRRASGGDPTPLAQVTDLQARAA